MSWALLLVPVQDLFDRRRPVEERRSLPHRQLPLPPGMTGRGGRARSHARPPRASRRTGSESAPPRRLPPRPPSALRRRRSSRTAVVPRRRARAVRRSDPRPTRLGLAVSAVIRATISSARSRPDPSPRRVRAVGCLRGERPLRPVRPRGTVTRPSRGATTRAGSSSAHSASARSKRLRAAPTSRRASARLPAAASSAAARAASGSVAVVPGVRSRSATEGLLEVVADDLVRLERGSTLRESIREALVELRAGGLRQRLVGGIPNQGVTEPVRLVVQEQPVGIGTDQVLPHERSQHRPELHVHMLGHERLQSAVVEHAPDDGSALQHRALGRLELVEAGGEQRLDRRRHADVPVGGVPDERDHLLDEQRVALGAAPDPLTERRVEEIARPRALRSGARPARRRAA